jgi:DNA-binding protein H-NS
MSRPTLVRIRQEIARLESRARKLEAAESARKQKAVAEVRALMKKLGVTPEDLGAPARARARPARAAKADGAKRGPVPVKYRNAETGDSWSGRGHTPRWLAALESQGRSRDDFLVK